MSWKNDQVTEKETERILELAARCLNVPGDYVEFGCYRGDTSLLLAEMLRKDAIFDELVEKCSRGGKMKIGAMEVLTRKDMRAIYQKANETV